MINSKMIIKQKMLPHQIKSKQTECDDVSPYPKNF